MGIELETAYCPDYLQPQTGIVRADIIRGLLKMRKQQPLVNLSDRHGDISIINSLRDFATDMNNGTINGFIGYSLKRKNILPEGDFVLSEVTEVFAKGRWNQGYFMVSGDYGLLLGFRQKQNNEEILLCGTSFSVTPDKHPLIIQLQGVKHFEGPIGQYKERKQFAFELMRKFCWEQVLVLFVMEWAQRNRLNLIYSQPGEENEWMKLMGLPKERAIIRYNQTVERLGFKRLGNGLYGFYLG